MSIFSKLFKLFITVVLLPLIPMALLLGYYQNRQKNSLLENHYNLAEVVSTQLSHYADGLAERLEFAAQLSEKSTQPQAVQDILSAALQQQPDLRTLALLKPDGTDLVHVLQGADTSELIAIEGLLPAQVGQLSARLSYADGAIPSLEFVYPLADGYYLYGRQSLNELAERLAQMRIGQTGQVYLADMNGQLQAGPYQWNPGVDTKQLAAKLSGKSRLIKSLPSEQGTLAGAISSEPRLGSYVAVLQPKEEALRSLYLSNTVIFLFLLSIAMLAYFGAQAFARSLGEPIAALIQGAQAVSHGNLDHRIKEEVGWGEFKDLIASFNKMTADLKDYQALQLKSQVSEMKEQVYRAVAHDLRAPLMGLQGYIYILSSGQVTDEERKDYLLRMADAAQNLSSMLEDVLAVSRVEAGMALPQREKVSVLPLVHHVLDTQRPAAESKSVELSCQMPDELAMWADPKLLRRIVTNLVSNAVKFTEKGFVKVIGGEDANTVWLQVQDSGIGLTPQQMAHLFEKFRQVDGHAEGYGLGLFISRQLARAHGGDLTVASEAGKGSTFTLRLPKEEK